jgi:hypothetical protein
MDELEKVRIIKAQLVKDLSCTLYQLTTDDEDLDKSALTDIWARLTTDKAYALQLKEIAEHYDIKLNI